MKYIKKTAEPLEFAQWKNSGGPPPSWSDFSGLAARPIRAAVLKGLLTDQGYICCYCERRIRENHTANIEHVKPRSQFRALSLDFSNLLASCAVTNRMPPISQHCNCKKGAWFDERLFISPLDPLCEEHFRFTGSGEIEPADNCDRTDAAAATIAKLGLNAPDLKAGRRKALDQLAALITAHPSRARELLEKYTRKDERGRFPAFCSTIRRYFTPRDTSESD